MKLLLTNLREAGKRIITLDNEAEYEDLTSALGGLLHRLHVWAVHFVQYIHQQIAERFGSLLAPVGENWWDYLKSWPNIEMFEEDGATPQKLGRISLQSVSGRRSVLIWTESAQNKQ